MVRRCWKRDTLEGWGKGMNHKLKFGNIEFEMSWRHPKGDILLATGDVVEFGEVRAET